MSSLQAPCLIPVINKLRQAYLMGSFTVSEEAVVNLGQTRPTWAPRGNVLADEAKE